MATVRVGLALGNINDCPAVLVGPGRHIGEDLGLARAAVAPKHHAGVCSFEVWQRDASDVLRTPQTIANFMIGREKQLVLVNFILLEFSG